MHKIKSKAFKYLTGLSLYEIFSKMLTEELCLYIVTVVLYAHQNNKQSFILLVHYVEAIPWFSVH